MKAAEIYAALGFKIEGEDQLKSFDTILKSIAQSATSAAAALKQLAQTKLPMVVGPQGKPSAPNPGTPAVVVPVTPTNQVPPILLPQSPPVIPSAKPKKNKDLEDLKKFLLGFATLGGLLEGLKKLVQGIKDMIQASRMAAFATDKFTTSTGLSRRELIKWQYLAKQGAVNEETVMDTIRRLNQNRAAIRRGEAVNLTGYTLAHVNPLADPGTQLRQFFANTKNFDQAMAESIGEMMGISADVVYLRNHMDKFGNVPRGTELSDKEQAAVMSLNSAWQELTKNMEVAAQKITADFAPAIESIIKIINRLSNNFITNPETRQKFYNRLFFPEVSMIGDLISSAIKYPVFPAYPQGMNNTFEMNFHGVTDQRMPAKAKVAVQSAINNAYYSTTPPQNNR